MQDSNRFTHGPVRDDPAAAPAALRPGTAPVRVDPHAVGRRVVMAASALAAPVIMLSAAAVVRAAPDSATVGGRFDSGATFDSGYSALAAVTVGKTAYDAVFRVPAPNRAEKIRCSRHRFSRYHQWEPRRQAATSNPGRFDRPQRFDRVLGSEHTVGTESPRLIPLGSEITRCRGGRRVVFTGAAKAVFKAIVAAIYTPAVGGSRQGRLARHRRRCRQFRALLGDTSSSHTQSELSEECVANSQPNTDLRFEKGGRE